MFSCFISGYVGKRFLFNVGDEEKCQIKGQIFTLKCLI